MTGSGASIRGRGLRNLGRSIIALVVVVCAGFLGIMLWGAYDAVQTLSQGAIERAAEQIHVELDRFFDPVEANLDVTMRWAAAGELDPRDVAEMNQRFVPLLESFPQISSMLVSTTDGVEYMLLRDGEEWVNRSTDVPGSPGVTYWSRWQHDASGPAQLWGKTVEYDPRKRPWFRQAVAAPPGTISWTEPYVFFTTKEPGITVSSRVRSPRGELVIAFDVLLLDISRFTSSLEISAGGKAAVLTDDLRVLGLPRAARFADPAAMKAAVLGPARDLGVSGVSEAVRAWRGAAGKDGKEGAGLDVLSYDIGSDAWLSGFRRYPLGARDLWVAVAVPEADFKGQSSRQHVALFALALLAIFAGTLLVVAYSRRSMSEIERAVDAAKRQLGQYQLEEKIGQGGMGAVYRASHMLMRRPTAVKLLRPDRASEEFIKRFEREVRLSCRLTHPNTIAIYDYGHTPEGTFYYAMELLNGISLARLLDVTGPIGEARTIHLVRQVCESLREAHAVGLVHRDIKPGNIHVCERGGDYDFIKVLDFGLVKDTSARDDDSALTQESSYGTPGFVAPEAIRDATQATAVSDIYSVGTVAYALLTAQTIFVEINRVKMLLRQLDEDPQTPSQRLRRAIAPDLEGVVMRCLARDPAARPQSMDELIAALDGCEHAGGWSELDARGWWQAHPELLDAEQSPLDEDDVPTLAVELGRR